MNHSPVKRSTFRMSFNTLVLIASINASGQVAASAQVALNPRTMPKTADVSPRYLGFNVEAVEVTGGRFWKGQNVA